MAAAPDCCNKVSGKLSNFWPDLVRELLQELTLDLKLGDLFLVKRGSRCGGSSLGYHHAGVYCCEVVQEIINFTSKQQTFSSQSLVGHGEVGKLDLEVFCEDDKFVVYRKENGIPGNFIEKVCIAKKRRPAYNILEYNCVHFALELLEVEREGDFTIKSPTPICCFAGIVCFKFVTFLKF
ncbi:hypothetical protein HF521_017271 [Silurus meridionalis]|uniref:Uncharacterized protein n=1 Tax=Silurus meridionalis TaxID=175797 RepID=A0A8T0BMG5_SILME|nr:hypothetical protein HF521_017271 [Silurus meridionalis]